MLFSSNANILILVLLLCNPLYLRLIDIFHIRNLTILDLVSIALYITVHTQIPKHFYRAVMLLVVKRYSDYNILISNFKKMY